MWSRKLKCANRSRSVPSVAGCTRSAPLMMPSTPPRSRPARSLVGGLAGRQLEGEVGRRRERVRALRQRLHPAGRPLQERHRTGQLGAKAAEDGCADTQHQTHVVVEGQPRHHREVRRSPTPASAKSLAHQLLEVHLQVAVRDHHPGGQSGSNPSCTADTPILGRSVTESLVRHRIQVHRIDLDDLGHSVQARVVEVFADVARRPRWW